MAILNVKNVPDALYARLRERARRDRRSVAQEAVHLLAQALQSDETVSIRELRGLGKDAWARTAAAAHVEEERASWT